MIRDDAAEALAQAEFFDICDDEQQRMLAFAGDLRSFAPDEVLYAAGDVPQGAYVLIAGTLIVHPDAAGAEPYRISEPGSVVSAMALILAKARALTVTAETECETLFVPRQAFMKLVQQSPVLAQRAVSRIEHELSGYLEALEPIRRRMKPSDL